MCELTANEVQTINPGADAIFTLAPVPCTEGFVRYRLGTGNILLSGWMPYGTCRKKNADYFVDFSCNVALPEGETVAPISVAIVVDGTVVPASTMISSPAAVSTYNNISVAKNVDIYRNCCETIGIRNIGTTPILMQNANLVIDR